MWQESGDVEHHLCILEPSVHTVLPCGVAAGGRGWALGAKEEEGWEGEMGGRDGGVDWREGGG